MIAGMPVHSLPGFLEPINAFLHLGASAVFAVLGGRLVRAHRGDRRLAVLLMVFVFTAVLMLSVSGVYHMLAGEAARSVMIRMDKAAIFVLIAGTFTPLHGLMFSGLFRVAGLVLMWAAAGAGVTLVTVFFHQIPGVATTSMYLALGWVASISMIALWQRRGFVYIRLILAGGLAYSIGAVLLELKWPTLIPRVFGPHELWHIAVIVGISLHWRFISHLARDVVTQRSRSEAYTTKEFP